MPNFKTHIHFGTILICLTAIIPSIVAFHIDSIELSIQKVLLTVFVGLIGTLIPDIDHNFSIINDIVYSCLTVTTVTFTTYVFVNQGLFTNLIDSQGYLYGLLITFGVVLLSMFVSYMSWRAFENYSTHRNNLHSLIILSLFSMKIVSIGYYPVKTVYSIDWAATMALSFLFLIIGAAGHTLLDKLL